MAQSYCNYGVYNPDTAKCMEEGESFDWLTFWEDGTLRKLTDVYIETITEDYIEIQLEDYDYKLIEISDVEDWD
ncbi:MAG: hypothetical protein Q4F05_11375 [bacterium]|nr:hypothetical protein [bacterium]